LSAEEFLSRCEKVKRTGPGRWVACCPAHDDDRPSMNVKEMPDSKLLVICRAGCTINSILEATGLPWSVLFAEDDERLYRREAKRAFPAGDVLRALAFESLVVCVVASDVKNRKEISDADWERLATAYQRIDAARKMVLGDD
jgi:hypothetical protein